MSSIKNTKIDGDVSVGRNVAVGGRATIQGRSHFKGSVKIDGWLEAKNIKGPNKGLFETVKKLREAYPVPHDGWWAIVGNTLPGEIYAADGGEWVDTGNTGGNPTIDSDEYVLDELEKMKSEVSEIKEDISDINAQDIPGIRTEISHINDKDKSQDTILTLHGKIIDDLQDEIEGIDARLPSCILDLGNMASVEAAMNAAKAYAVVSNQNTRIIVWTHENDAGIIFQTHLGMEHVRQLALLDGSPAKCKARNLTINITDHTVADGGWQELITPVSFSYDSVKRAITANGPKNPGNEPAISWPVVTLPLAGSSYAGLMEPADKKKLGCIVDLGVVSNQAAAENAAADRSITENSNVRIIMWRTGDNGQGDGGSIIQSRWGTHYVAQVMMFVGQERSCRYRLITTGGNYNVGEWNDLIIPGSVSYDTATHQVRYRGIRPNVEKTLFTIPVADDEKLGIVRIGKSFYLGEDDELNVRIGKGLTFDESGNIQAKVNTAHGLGFYRDNSLAVKAGKGIAFEEDTGGITVLFDKGLSFDEDGKLCVNAGEGITFDDNGGVAIHIGTDTDKYKGLIFNDGSRTIGVDAGNGLTFDRNKLVLNPGNGFALDKEGRVNVNIGSGLKFGSDGSFNVHIGTGLRFDTGDPYSNITVRLSTDGAIVASDRDGGLMVNYDDTRGLSAHGDQPNKLRVVIGTGPGVNQGGGLRFNSSGGIEVWIGTALTFDEFGTLTVDIPKLKEILGLN